MATKLQLITDLYGDTAKQVTDSVDGWKSYLTSAARLYKYSFDEQLLIYAQRPDATACAAMELWNGKMNRWVKPGSKGIALIHKNASGKPHLEYVFDVADTRPVKGAKTPWLWEMHEELHDPVLARLEARYGETEGDFGDRLMELAARAVGENYREHLRDLTYDMEDSFLEGLDDLNLEVRFRNILTSSVQFTLLTRCGLDPSLYLEDEDLQGITEFSTTAVLSHIGNATSDLSGTMLVEIGNAIRENQRSTAQNLQNPLANQPVIGYTEVTEQFNTLKRERSMEHGRIDISEERGLSDSQPHDGGNRDRGNAGQIRDAAPDLLAGTPERDVHLHADDGQAVAASAGDRPDGTDAGGQHAEALDGAQRRERADESHRPNEVGAGSEQPETDGRGIRAEGIDLQLTPQEPEPQANGDWQAEGVPKVQLTEDTTSSGSEKLPDFVSTQSSDLLFGLLQNDRFLKKKRPAIADFFEKHPDGGERITYLKSLRDNAYTEFDVGVTRVGFRAYDIGLLIWTGHYPSRTSVSMLSWDSVQELTADMMKRGEYLTLEDKPLKPSLATPPAFTQITLFPSVEQQIEHIAEAQAEEKRSPAFSHAPVLPVPQGVIDRVLSSGSSQWHSIERIVANFQQDRTGSAHENFLKAEYGEGGKGFSIAGKEYAVWFGEDGLHIAPGRRANVPGCTVVPWIQVAVRIGELLQVGTFATQEKIDAARPNAYKELAESLWYMRQNFSDEAREQGYTPIISENYGGFPDSTKKIAKMLADPAQREAIISEVSEFADAYAADRDLMRWRQYQPQKLLPRLEALRTEPVVYTADPNFEAKRPSFITEDEIDAMLTRGSGISDGKMRIASYFMQGHDPADRARFLREEYGTGGGGHRGYNSDHDSKGLSFIRADEVSGFSGYDKVHLNWNQVEKRISGLIKADRYLNASEKAYIPEYESLIVARQVYAFFRYAPKDEEQTFSWDWNVDAAKIHYLPKLTDPKKAAELLAEMRQIAAFLPPDYRYRESMEQALAETERYVSGEYSLFTPLAPERLQAERDEKQKQTKRTPAEKPPVDNLAAAARALARKKPSAVKETGDGQLSFDFLVAGASSKPEVTPSTVSDPELDEESVILATHADAIEEAQAILDERGYVTESDSLFLDALERLDELPTAVEIADAVEEILLEDEHEIIRNSYNLGYGHMGNGLTVWNQLEKEDGDYKTIAHISPDRTVKYYDTALPDLIKAQIEEIAATSEMTISATQVAPVFQTAPTQEPRTPETAPKPNLSKLSVDLFVAFQTNKMDSWQTNIPKQQRIKSALYQILKDKNETERTFSILYNNNPLNAAELQKYLELSYHIGDEVTFTFDGVTNVVALTKITEDDIYYQFTDLEQEPVSMARSEFEKYLVQGQAAVLNQAHTMDTTNEQPAPTEPVGEGERAIKDIYSNWLPVVVSRVLDNETYQNACRNSDEQNARTELYALLDKTALDIMPEDSGFYNLYTGMPAFHNRLRQEVFDKTYTVLSKTHENIPKSPADLYHEYLPKMLDRFYSTVTYHYLRDNKPNREIGIEETKRQLNRMVANMVDIESRGFRAAYVNCALFSDWLASDIYDRVPGFWTGIWEDSPDLVTLHANDTDMPMWVHTGTTIPAETTNQPDLAPLVDAYLNLKAQYPDRIIGVQVGDHVLFYGKDAETAAPALGSNLLTQEIPGLGETAVTGSTLGWQSNLVSLLNSGHSVLFANPSEENPSEYEIIKERTAAEYIPIGMELTIDGRRMRIDSVNFNAGTVDLLDLDLKGWFPIFRSESVHFVRSYVEEQQTIGYIEAAPLEQAVIQEDSPQPIADRQEKPLEPVEIEGGRLIDVVIDLRPREAEKTAPAQHRHNFHITDDNLGAGGQKTKYQANIAAIRTLKQIEADQRLATPEEQETLSRYVGWGGIADAFDPAKENWAKEYAELKDLLTPEEYQSAQGSVLNAHYTSPTVIKAMYSAVEQMELNPGNILEPAMGVGNFFGLVPESMEKSRLYGVELDSLTGRIAKQLYQKADITISGFEKTDRRDFYDLAVGNVPFGQYKVSDKPYDKLNFPIHDYFLAKSIDQLRPGGIMAVVTSHYTLDKQNSAARQYLAIRADLLGAIRLPNNAFKQNANTEVTSDILFFQKRDHAPEREPEWVKLGETVDGITVNRYFADNPHMILGEMVTQSGQFGTEITCQPIPGESLSDQLAAAIQRLAPPDRELLTAEPPEAASSVAERESIPADPNVRNFSFALVDGGLYFRENSRMKPVELGKTPTERVKGMLSIRDCARRLIDLQLTGASESEIEQEQARLNVLYDRFTKSHGLLNSLGNKQAFECDSSYPLLCSLEILDEEGNLERKADMFTKRTIQRPRAVTSVDTASEALAVSIGEKACVDIGYMGELMGGSEKVKGIIKDLQGVIFKDPLSDPDDLHTGWQAADEYLSGNVREKLAIAREAAGTHPEFAINVERLEQIQPKELSAAEIDVRIGATWIAPKYYAQFMFELLHTPSNLQDSKIDIRYAPINGEWNVRGKSEDSKNNARAYATYGTKRINAYAIIENALNLRDTRIFDTKYEDGKEVRVLNPKETAIAQQKQEAIGEAFREWVFKTPERREELCKTYNELYNSTRPP